MKYFQRFILIVLLFGCCSGCGSIASSCYFKTRERMNTFVEIEQGKIHYVRQGEGTPIVYIHGNLGTHLDFTLSPLAKTVPGSHSVIAVDRWGSGYSRRPEKQHVTLAKHADIIAAVVDALKLEKPIIMGHSYGGAVSLMYALRHPEKLSGLVLLAPAAHDWEGEGVSEYRFLTRPFIGPLLMETVFVPIAALQMRSAFRAVFDPAPVPSAYLEAAARSARIPEHFIASAMDMQVVRPGLATIASQYSAIKTPTVVITGGKDTITPYWNHGERLEKHLPNARVYVIPDAGHQVHFSHPEIVTEALEYLESELIPATQ